MQKNSFLIHKIALMVVFEVVKMVMLWMLEMKCIWNVCVCNGIRFSTAYKNNEIQPKITEDYTEPVSCCFEWHQTQQTNALRNTSAVTWSNCTVGPLLHKHTAVIVFIYYKETSKWLYKWVFPFACVAYGGSGITSFHVNYAWILC